MRFSMEYSPVKDSWFVSYNLGKRTKKSFKVSKHIDHDHARTVARYWLDEMVERSGRPVLGGIAHDGYEGNYTYLL